jgi:hypothetical protein
MTKIDAIVGSTALKVRFINKVVIRKIVFKPQLGLVVLVGENG